MAQSPALRYLLTGGAAFVLDFGLLALFHEVFGWAVWLATGVAFGVTFVFNFTVQKIFSFSAQGRTTSRLLRFTMLVAFNSIATIGIVAIVDTTPLGWVWGKVISTAVTTVWNYFAYRYWVFAPASAGAIDPDASSANPQPDLP